VQIITPVIPKRLTVTAQMLEDFLCDPVLGFKVILGIDLDVFQRCRLKYYWWVPEVIDSSGFSSGKTIVDWGYVQLRCILLSYSGSAHDAGVYYPVFETGKRTFWRYYSTVTAPIFSAHLGRLDETGEEKGSAKVQGAACYMAYFKNGATVAMPAPSFMKNAFSQSSLRFNTMLIDEWTHIDASSDGIDSQLIGRVTKESWNQSHPIWSNHITFSAPAKTQLHPAHERYSANEKQVKRGNPDYATISYNFKDYSDLPTRDGGTFKKFRVQRTIDTLRDKLDRADALGEVFGVWSKSGKGWFTEEAILSCVELGRQRNLEPMTRN